MARWIVAVTGGIASGKSELTRRFEALGVRVVDADAIARAIVAPGEPALGEIVARFGSALLDANGALDRAALRAKAFSDPEARRALEAITHPRIRARLEQDCRAAPGAYALAAIPLLAEGSGRKAYPWLARILVVDAPISLQRSRLQARDGADPALVERMISAQASRATRLALADDIVVNDGSPDALDAIVMRLHDRYRRLAGDLD